MDHITTKFYTILKNGVKKELSKFYPNIDTSVRALIEAEVDDEKVINICIDISCRKCIEIVYNWIFNYINVDGNLHASSNVSSFKQSNLILIAISPCRYNKEKWKCQSGAGKIENDRSSVGKREKI